MKRKIGLLLCLVLVTWGGIRLYYAMTDGFRVAHISSDFSFDPRFETRSLTLEEKQNLKEVLGQPYHYLGKGCQSYVFASQDGEHVIKFFKYQRTRPKPWDDFFAFIPAVDRFREKKIARKTAKRERFFDSWRVSFDHLHEETGLVFVHLNKTEDLNVDFTIYDKMGFEHHLDLDQYEFAVQKRAEMICDVIDQWMAEPGGQEKTEALLDELMAMIELEYDRGFGDHDHALIQNTGVYYGKPLHIDFGQFAFFPEVSDKEIRDQELFNKTYKFRLWLAESHPSLATYFDDKLQASIGDKINILKPTHLLSK